MTTHSDVPNTTSVDDPVPTPFAAPPHLLRAAYAEIIVTDLAASRAFYVDILGLTVTAEDSETLYLRAFEEFMHHNLVLRQGPVPALRALAFRVATPEDVDQAEVYFHELGCRVERDKDGFVKGIGDAVRVLDPLGFPLEFFHDVEHAERLIWAYDQHGVCPIIRLDHFNQVTPDIPRGVQYLTDLGFKVSEDIQDDEGTVYASWLRAKQSVHDAALTGGAGPRLHHIAFATYERSHINALCDKLGAMRLSDHIERGPGRHGVSNAFYLYLRDPDGHRIEIYTSDYYTGDPDNPTVTWDVHDNQRREWWGSPLVKSWYEEAASVLDLDGNVMPVQERTDDKEHDVTVGADGFSYTRKEEASAARAGAQPSNPQSLTPPAQSIQQPADDAQ